MLRISTIFLVILLSACSGADIFGKQEQEIIITSTINTVLINGNITITAASTGTIKDQGTGVITYHSSNPTIASINNTTGVVTGIRIGSVDIIATKAEDDIFASASASTRIRVNVNAVTNTITNPLITYIVSGNEKVSLIWTAVNNSTNYNIYYATQTIIGFANLATNYDNLSGGGRANTRVTNVTILNLQNNEKYYFVVTAIVANLETNISNEVMITPTIVTATIGALNDTGIDFSGNINSGNSTDCDSSDTTNYVSQQDCYHGRDYLASINLLDKIGNGEYGFDFTKFDSSGNPSSSQRETWEDVLGSQSNGNRWSCVRDNNTGLYWEVKIDTGTAPATITAAVTTNLRHKNNGFYWGDVIVNDNAWGFLVTYLNNNAFCGLSSWRVPTIDELTSIAYQNNNGDYALDEHYFPNTADDNHVYWSSSQTPDNRRWFFSFSNGVDGYSSRNGNGYAHIRLVSGATSSFRGDARYNTSTIGVTTDTTTNLMWKTCAEGQIFGGITCSDKDNAIAYNWQEALSAVKNINIVGFSSFNDWRLPNLAELRSLVKRDVNTPSINTTMFPQTSSVNHWSSTPHINGNSAYSIHFKNGDDAINLRDARYLIRLVRNL